MRRQRSGDYARRTDGPSTPAAPYTSSEVHKFPPLPMVTSAVVNEKSSMIHIHHIRKQY